MTKQKIEQRQIWLIVTDDFVSNGCQIQRLDRLRNRESRILTKYEKGEYIEIRYQSPWHFRTLDNVYDSADDDVILKNCILIGKVKAETAFENEKKLDEILAEGLFDMEVKKYD